MTEFYLALTLHNHQPVGNFPHVMEEAYQRAYRPMLEALEKHPTIRLTIHNTGCLLDWLTAAHPEYIVRLVALAERGQVELMGGGYYEPILASLPDADKRGQLKKQSDAVERLCGSRPSGAWLAERVWEPHLPRVLNEAGLDYTLLDDTHFSYAGLNDDDMLGYYVTEEQGFPLKVFGTARHLRYTVPWVPVGDVIDWLRTQASADLPRYNGKPRIAVMGDDGEKFGLWPGTYELCWGDEGWIEHFFSAIEANADWLTMTTLSDYAQNQPSLGQIYIPAASYVEMTEWALPMVAQQELVQLKRELRQRDPRPLKFMKGGLWRSFMAKYPEVNQMHKKALWVSERVHALPESPKKQQALDHLWAAQCNCSYWHGLFGGVYLFHIRGANYRNLIAAEAATLPDDAAVSIQSFDFTRNGSPDLILSNAQQWLCIEPSYGGSLVEWDLRAAPYNLLNTMTRRPEAYHQTIRAAAEHGTILAADDLGDTSNLPQPVIHAKARGLTDKLDYDWYRRGALQVRVLPADSESDLYFANSGELGDFITQPWSMHINTESADADVTLTRDGLVWDRGMQVPVTLSKRVRLSADSNRLHVTLWMLNMANEPLSVRIGLENNWGLEGGQDPLTWLDGLGELLGERRFPGEMGAATQITSYTLVSDIATVNSCIHQRLSQPADVWWFPIETVTNSESGYELNYQGTAMLNSWRVDLEAGARWSVEIEFEISKRR